MKKLLNIIKKVILWSIGSVVGLYALLYLLMLLPPSPFKISDPANQLFNFDKFQFNDYDGRDFAQAMDVLFPKGTKKEEIDHILIDIGGATYRRSKKIYSNNYHIYSHSSWQSKVDFMEEFFGGGCMDYSVSICFDSNEQLVRAYYTAPCGMTISRKEVCPDE